MSLLREIQDAAIDVNVDISVVLRKCKVLAARLGNKEFKLWVEYELNGYTSKEDLPEYRILRVESRGDFFGMFQSGLKNAPIPSSSIPEEYRDLVNTSYLMQAISFYASLTKDTERTGDTLRSPWSADLIRLVGSEIYQDMNLGDAWQQIPYGAIAALLDTVRNRILSFVLGIEAEAPDAGEAPPNVKPIADDRVSQVFNTYIQGNVTSLVAGSQTITQNIEITVVQNDLESLKQYLASLGIGEPDLKELDQAIREDAQSGVKGNLGNKVKVWLGKMISKAGSSAWNVATSIAANLLIKALSKYYGFEL